MSMKPRTSADIRKRELAQIHVAKSQLGLDEETYRAMLWTVARVKSAADLDWAGRKKVLDHLKAGGFKIKSRPAPAANKAGLVSKIRALLIALDNKPDGYADGMARHMFHIERFEWCDSVQLRKIIAALGYQQKRLEAERKVK
jgi:phage gp16-like protein